VALSLAAEKGHDTIVRLLIEAGVHKDVRDAGVKTTRQLAAENSHGLVVQILN
jgi:ankyrin repeat protein